MRESIGLGCCMVLHDAGVLYLAAAELFLDETVENQLLPFLSWKVRICQRQHLRAGCESWYFLTLSCGEIM